MRPIEILTHKSSHTGISILKSMTLVIAGASNLCEFHHRGQTMAIKGRLTIHMCFRRLGRKSVLHINKYQLSESIRVSLLQNLKASQ
jgi:hypothetical protein